MTVLQTPVYQIGTGTSAYQAVMIYGTDFIHTGLLQSTSQCKNLLANGGMWFAQRQAPATLTTIATEKYSADRWRICRESASLQYQRTDTAGAKETGLNARYYGTWKQITNAGKFMLIQWLEGASTQDVYGINLWWQAKMKASTTQTIRMGLVTWAGTMDTLPATTVTAWGANGTDPTLTANLAFVTPVTSYTVGTTWSLALPTAAGAFSGTKQNLGLAIWTDSQFAANDTLSVSEVMLTAPPTDSSSPILNSVWSPEPLSLELIKCLRFYEKSYLIDTAPATASAPNYTPWPWAGATLANSAFLGQALFTVKKRATPVVAVYSFTSGTASVVSDGNGTDLAAGSGTTVAASESRFLVENVAGSAITPALGMFLAHWTADAEL